MMNVSAIEVGRNAAAEPAPFQDPSINLSMEEGRRADVANKSFADPVLEGSFVARERAIKAGTVPDLNDTFGDFHQGACRAIWARLNDPASEQTIFSSSLFACRCHRGLPGILWRRWRRWRAHL